MQETITPMGMGVMQISFSSFPDEERVNIIISSIRVLLTHAKSGQKTIINTALIYGMSKGASEELLASVLLKLTPEEQQKLIVATWVGLDGIAIETEAVDHQLTGPESMYTKDGAYQQFISGSFKNLKMELLPKVEFWVGLHRVNPRVSTSSQAEQLKMIANNPHVSKVGLSEVSLKTLQEFEQIVPIAFLETEMSLSRQFALRSNILDYCKKHNIILLAYSPLDRSIWTSRVDKIEDWLALGQQHPFLNQLEGWVNEDIVRANYQQREKVVAIANKLNISLNELALAWIMAKGAIPIPDSTSPERSASNFNAIKLQDKLTKDDIAILDGINFLGKRYK